MQTSQWSFEISFHLRLVVTDEQNAFNIREIQNQMISIYFNVLEKEG